MKRKPISDLKNYEEHRTNRKKIREERISIIACEIFEKEENEEIERRIALFEVENEEITDSESNLKEISSVVDIMKQDAEHDNYKYLSDRQLDRTDFTFDEEYDQILSRIFEEEERERNLIIEYEIEQEREMRNIEKDEEIWREFEIERKKRRLREKEELREYEILYQMYEEEERERKEFLEEAIRDIMNQYSTDEEIMSEFELQQKENDEYQMKLRMWEIMYEEEERQKLKDIEDYEKEMKLKLELKGNMLL